MQPLLVMASIKFLNVKLVFIGHRLLPDRFKRFNLWNCYRY